MMQLGEKLKQITDEREDSIRQKKEQVEEDIESSFNGNNGLFLSGLRKDVIMAPDHPHFDKVYDLYSRTFTLESERTPREGLEGMLRLNSDPNISAKYGLKKEFWLFLSHPSKDEVVGASNIDVYMFDNDDTRTRGTLHEIYVMTAPEYRNLSIGTLLLEWNREFTEKFIRENGNEEGDISFRVLNEQNDPLKMTAEEYLQDTENAGIDQCDRLLWWQRRGYIVLDFDYIQPPLTVDAEPSLFLTLNMQKEGNESEVPVSLVIDHLQRFVYFTILYGKDPMKDQYFVKMKEQLGRRLESTGTLGILNPDYRKLKQDIYSLDVTESKFDVPIGELLKSG